MLPTAVVVESVIFTAGVAQAFGPRCHVGADGTIGVSAATEFGTRLGKLRLDVLFVDAPVSGSRARAEAGELLILASGPPTAKAAANPAFDGRRSRWRSSPGRRLHGIHQTVTFPGIVRRSSQAGLCGPTMGGRAAGVAAPSPGPSAPSRAGSQLRQMRRCTGIQR